MRNAAWRVGLLVLLAGCGGAERGGAPPPDSVPGRDTSGPAPVVPEVPLDDTFHTLEFVVPSYRAHRERGVGVVHPTGYLAGDTTSTDTVRVHTRPQSDAPVAARLLRSPMGVFEMQVRADVAESGGLEWGYEDIGLPLLEDPDAGGPSDWLQVYYGTSSAGDLLSGWVRSDTTSVAYFLWSDRLLEFPLFFLDPDSMRFHESVAGPTVSVPLTPTEGTQRYDYILNSLETQGEWMRAEVVSPSNYCFDPPRPVRDTVWIRYLDAGKRPRVWYYTRGC